jgi:hypothetical protein
VSVHEGIAFNLSATVYRSAFREAFSTRDGVNAINTKYLKQWLCQRIKCNKINWFGFIAKHNSCYAG